MKGRKWAGRGLLLLGLVPFLFALGFCLVSCLLDSGRTSFWEYLVMWSFLYWYTYVIGMILLVLSAVLREKSKHG
ncbi:hypothetical protein AALA83_10070 [Oscillospiraceae bacterium 44-5]|jgi:hypothetical protein|uniref:hypothetical protein n=1 Tax=Lawsonibacter sp. JLR.KK007 TaxID=3114293 RepID=UPI002FEFE026